MKSANFLTIINYNKKIFNEFDNWYSFMIDKECDEFIASSKHFREVFFGEIKTCKKSHSLYKYYLDNVYEFIKNKYKYNDNDVVCISNDEIVLKYRNFTNVKTIINNFPNMFNVNIFTLEKPSIYSYYIKNTKYTGNDIRIIKCVPKKYVSQFIKLIRKEKIVENDLKFIDDKQIAKYEKQLFNIETEKLTFFTIIMNYIETFISTVLIISCIGKIIEIIITLNK